MSILIMSSCRKGSTCERYGFTRCSFVGMAGEQSLKPQIPCDPPLSCLFWGSQELEMAKGRVVSGGRVVEVPDAGNVVSRGRSEDIGEARALVDYGEMWDRQWLDI